MDMLTITIGDRPWTAEIIYRDDAWIIAGDGDALRAVSRDDGQAYPLEGLHPDGPWVALESPDDIRLHVDRDDWDTAPLADLVRSAIEARTLRVRGAIHGLPGGHPLGAVMC